MLMHPTNGLQQKILWAITVNNCGVLQQHGEEPLLNWLYCMLQLTKRVWQWTISRSIVRLINVLYMKRSYENLLYLVVVQGSYSMFQFIVISYKLQRTTQDFNCEPSALLVHHTIEISGCNRAR